MEQALQSAIYYVKSADNVKYHIVTELLYDGTKENFSDVIGCFRSNIQIRNLFGNKENICYGISDNLVKYYDKLLLDQLDNILIVTRCGDAIKISNDHNNEDHNKDHDNDHNNEDHNKDDIIGVIKIDSVIVELYADMSNNLNRRNWNWYKYPLCLVGFVGLYFLMGKVYWDDVLFQDFQKSD